MAELRRASPQYAALRYPQPLDVTRAQAALDPGTLLLNYFVDDEATYLFTVTPTHLGVHRLTIKDGDLQDAVQEFNRAISDPRGRFEARGHELYKLLVGPAQTEIARAKRLLICPDGPLHALPFAALVSDLRGPQYLIEARPLHVIVSMGVYDELRKRRSEGDQVLTLLALGHPSYEFVEGGSQANRLPGLGGSLPPLPHTRQEVEAIGKLYGPQRARVKVGAQASEAAAKSECRAARVLHFACHGLLDDRDPFGSALALSPNGEKEDGLLRAEEIMGKMKTNANLVVLSACSTGRGQESKHEGIIGMARAFQYAGARSVVVSMWNVADESASHLMIEFHRQFIGGKPKDEALRLAQLKLIRLTPGPGKRLSHPFFWAPFVLVGDWR